MVVEIRIKDYNSVMLMQMQSYSRCADLLVRARRPAGHGGSGHGGQVVLARRRPVHGRPRPAPQQVLLRWRHAARRGSQEGLRPKSRMLYQSAMNDLVHDE